MQSSSKDSSAVRCHFIMAPSLTTVIAAVLGFMIGTAFPISSFTKFEISSLKFMYGGDTEDLSSINNSTDIFKIYEPSNPKGSETLPPGIVVSESDLYQHRLWGNPDEDLPLKPKYLAVFTVGYQQKEVVNAEVQKFSENFTILLFHYDGRVNEWDEFEWSQQAIHISTRKQAKWWYAKRFLHPDIVAAYDYIFIWDEDLGVEHFDAEEYIKLVRKYNLDISQPAVDSSRYIVYPVTRRRNGTEVHTEADEAPGTCPDHQPPCTEFIEIMAPVFSRDAWRCVWHMIQNDLVHGWGLDFVLRNCAEPARYKIGVVDAQWIFHHATPTLRDQGKEENSTANLAQAIHARCYLELATFKDRWRHAERDYYIIKGLIPANATEHFTRFP
ncbi:hypothetical protein LUZ63_004052 [Rhynchospora breviuscula]|uniref:Uncharacterized protein n=1 Tax=Rhynchospora breviuscula TaxID=2022672 RepID=A0A9Q0D1U7_9POAL|nr:hypothetical protein LUZ63_004052 [Rhynchospora breviuscula]